ncbi:MAG: hypothetical protein KDB23_17320, partial [Planctomycetales bacterium]|nr:hypothetical protein [Planctomycetales bacterium]
MGPFISLTFQPLNDNLASITSFARAMFWQVSVLVAILLVADLLLRRHLTATSRYWLWMLVPIKLLLPVDLSTPVSLGYWVFPQRAPQVRSIAAARQTPLADNSVSSSTSPESAEATDATIKPELPGNSTIVDRLPASESASPSAIGDSLSRS